MRQVPARAARRRVSVARRAVCPEPACTHTSRYGRVGGEGHRAWKYPAPMYAEWSSEVPQCARYRSPDERPHNGTWACSSSPLLPSLTPSSLTNIELAIRMSGKRGQPHGEWVRMAMRAGIRCAGSCAAQASRSASVSSASVPTLHSAHPPERLRWPRLHPLHLPVTQNRVALRLGWVSIGALSLAIASCGGRSRDRPPHWPSLPPTTQIPSPPQHSTVLPIPVHRPCNSVSKFGIRLPPGGIQGRDIQQFAWCSVGFAGVP